MRWPRGEPRSAAWERPYNRCGPLSSSVEQPAFNRLREVRLLQGARLSIRVATQPNAGDWVIQEGPRVTRIAATFPTGVERLAYSLSSFHPRPVVP